MIFQKCSQQCTLQDEENIRDLETGLSEILRLKPRRFDWKEETKIGEKNVASAKIQTHDLPTQSFLFLPGTLPKGCNGLFLMSSVGT